ncbi:hypothetical protein D9611_013127 [Ephemerocybe angulata]|uniref:Amine oxidase domain-containing protein n=1 Tax=Ephemerocybe angulata TaxID=980116 RepID=A0A8H5BXB5_9AGAR|nr:hypothetical protein D9611_013127 [Tulosesus angulatus]
MPRIDTPATRQDVFAQYGRNIAQTMVDRKKASLPPFIAARSFGSLSADAAAPRPPQFCVKSTHKGGVPVGILGGGMAGLYAALILAHHKVSFQIIEATERVGGRCFTYNFEEGGEWDYYIGTHFLFTHKDVGAMRFPLPKKGEIGPHLRLKQLFDYLKLPLFDYIYKNNTGLMYFNEVHSTIGDTEQLFRAGLTCSA